MNENGQNKDKKLDRQHLIGNGEHRKYDGGKKAEPSEDKKKPPKVSFLSLVSCNFTALDILPDILRKSRI